MTFKELNLKSTYDSSKDNVIEDFYVPILEKACKYDRVAGYFNPHSLALVAKGLLPFIENGGKMRLLCGIQLSVEDFNSIRYASDIEEKISKIFIDDLNNIDNELEINHLKLLAWMINENILDIKLGIVKNSEGYIGGIIHEKIGILTDSELNNIIFLGSNNETLSSWSSTNHGNFERFKVFLEWEDTKFIKDDIIYFEEEWNNINPYLEVMDIPKDVKEHLIKLAPSSFGELKEMPLSISDFKSDDRILRDYQNEALNKWIKHDMKGIFEMATGTGKTFTAINCIDKAREKDSNLVTVIVCPYAHLVEQWANDVEKFFDTPVYRIYGSGNSNWKKDFSRLILNLNLNIIKNPIILTTDSSFSKDFFKDKINSIINPKLLVVDEMHHLVAPTKCTGLLESYNYRLGLSATPEVYNNEEGTEFLLNYFGGIIYSFNLSDALVTINKDTNETFLAPYDYYPMKIKLTDFEIEQYFLLTSKIAQAFHQNKDSDENESIKSLIRKRRNIINNAHYKYDCLRQIINSYDEIDHLIVFCSPEQKNNVLNILKEENVTPRHQFTSEEGTKKTQEFDGLSEREFLIKKFDEGFYKALVAIRCLDEGVDVPSADKVIIMASSNNPKEYIQRRGRVLRRSDGKLKAEIYDMAVIASDQSGNLIESIVKNESKRLLDFIYTSNNPNKGMDLLNKWGIINE